jgi:4-hydroxy-tetrahydrodipicolinate synthase
LRRFSHLSVFTGTETHVPQLLASGGRGTICGLANVMPRLMRAMFDAPNLFERRRHIQQILGADIVLSRWPFIASVKALVADSAALAAWRRVLPPMSELPVIEEQRMIADFRRWESTLPQSARSLYPADTDSYPKVVSLRRG